MLMSCFSHHLFLVPSLSEDFQVLPALNLKQEHDLSCSFLEVWLETGNILIEDSQSNVITSPPLANQVVYYQDDG